MSDDLRFTRKSWIAERLGWGLLGSVIVAAVLGGLGPGLLSPRSAAGSTLLVDYERFGNLKTEASVDAWLTARPEDGGLVSLWIEQMYLDDVTIEEIRPHPVQVKSGPDRTTYLFAVPEGESTVRVRFHVVPEKPGRLAGRFGRAAEGLDVRQFIYP